MNIIIIDTKQELEMINRFLHRKKFDHLINPLYLSIISIKECILGFIISNGMGDSSFSNAYNNVDLNLYALKDITHMDKMDGIITHIQFIIEPNLYDKLERYLLPHLGKYDRYYSIKILKNGLTVISLLKEHE